MFRLSVFIWQAVAMVLFQAIVLKANARPTMETIRTFENASEEPRWTAQNDGVMGGVSAGASEINAGALRFFGNLSLENNGGFAQIYSPSERSDFSAFSAIKLRVKGDGRVYQFRLATDARYRWSPIAYRSEFKTEAGQWIEVALPFTTFSPGFRGRMLTGPPLDLTNIRRLAFLLSDGTAGPFSLEIDWIGLQ